MLHYALNPHKLFNKHLGQACFIIGTGPSLNNVDLTRIENEFLFGVNTLYKHAIATSCNYFAVCDEVVWENHKKQLSILATPVFSALYQPPARSKNIVPLKKLGLYTGQGINLQIGIYKTETVIGTCLQLAYYMGFQTIYLLGCDCNYENAHHFDGAKVDNFKREDWSPVFAVYDHLKQTFAKDNRVIYNCTPGGKLEVFPRLDYNILIDGLN